MKKELLTVAMLGVVTSSWASDYGCKVLLCLANPASNGGPKGVAECVPPINQLYHDLRKGRPFPTCDLADGNDGSSYARQVYDPYDPCPATLRAAARGTYVVQGQKAAQNSLSKRWEGHTAYTFNGQPQISEPRISGDDSPGPRACVGKPVGSYTLGSYEDSYTVSLFDKVVWQTAQNPRAIDIFIDNKWQQRVRW